MKTRAILLAAAAVFLTAPAFADQNDNQDNNDKKHQMEQRQDARQDAAEHRRDVRADRRQDAREDRRDDRADARHDRYEAAAENRMDRRITRENIREFRANANAARRYHYSQAWNAPSGWHYQRYAYGQHMPSLFYGQNYWIVNFGGFGLYAPPEGYRWVRYGNDAVLVDVSSGEIIRVEYNNFY